MKILALDQSLSRSGWAVLEHAGKIEASGWFGIKVKDRVPTRQAVDTFKDQVRQLILDYRPEALAWERPGIFRSQRANLTGARLDEALVALADSHELATMNVAAATWRSQVLGKGAGRLSSEEAKQRALLYCRWMGFETTDHNQAEAICIGLWALSRQELMG